MLPRPTTYGRRSRCSKYRASWEGRVLLPGRLVLAGIFVLVGGRHGHCLDGMTFGRERRSQLRLHGVAEHDEQNVEGDKAGPQQTLAAVERTHGVRRRLKEHAERVLLNRGTLIDQQLPVRQRDCCSENPYESVGRTALEASHESGGRVDRSRGSCQDGALPSVVKAACMGHLSRRDSLP